ncbi:hypothetical protein V493_05392 [Pseudogymnoascus sp. VKM F-4281 (FW-2241)]|nr:hypothetical protein V493_05392 [Pseudogymnoascus sp. VKM F-4281 (FW-2241)]
MQYFMSTSLKYASVDTQRRSYIGIMDIPSEIIYKMPAINHDSATCHIKHQFTQPGLDTINELLPLSNHPDMVNHAAVYIETLTAVSVTYPRPESSAAQQTAGRNGGDKRER